MAGALLLGSTGLVIALLLAVPGQQLAEEALSTVTGRGVRMDSLVVEVGWSIRFEVSGLRIDAHEADALPLLEVPTARARHSWPRLLTGQLLPLVWEVDSPVLRLEPSAEGGSGLPDIPDLTLQVDDGRVEYRTGEGEPWIVDDLEVRTLRGGIGARTRGQVRGRLLRGETPVGRAEADLDGWLDDGKLIGTLSDWQLGLLPTAPIPARGVLAGAFELERDGDALALTLDARADDLAVDVPGMRETLQPASARVAARLAWDAPRVVAELRSVEFDDLQVGGRIAIDTARGGRIEADLHVADFEPGARDRIHFMSLMSHRFASWDRVYEMIEGGTAYDLRLRCDFPWRDFARVFSFEVPAPASDLRIEATVRDGVFRPEPGDVALTDIRGRVVLSNDVLDIRDVRARQGESELPVIDVRIDGMHVLAHLPGERPGPDGPGVAIPGLGPMLETLTRGERADADGTLPRIAFASLRLDHPTAILPVREASGEVRFDDTGTHVRAPRARVGGAPAAIAVDWSDGGSDEPARLSVNVTYEPQPVPLPPVDAGAPDAPPAGPGPAPWLGGEVRLERVAVGRFELSELIGQLDFVRDRLEIRDLRGRIGGGAIFGAGSVRLSQPGEAPYELGIQAYEVDAAQVAPWLGISGGTVEGRARANGRLAGVMNPQELYLERADIDLHVEVEEGRLANLPAALTLARLPSLSGVMGLMGKPLPFDRMASDVAVREGELVVRDFRLEGPQLRITAGGEIDLLEAGNPVDMVVALLFLQTVDRVIGSLPIVRDLVLGEDRNLFGIYLRLTGPWEQPTARVIPPDTIGAAARGARQVLKWLPIPGTR